MSLTVDDNRRPTVSLAVEEFLRSLFGAIRRRPGAALSESKNADRVRTIFFGAVLLSTLFFLMVVLQREIAHWGNLSVSVPISASDWRVVFDKADCGGACVTGPSSVRLATSSLTRGDATYRSMLSAQAEKPVWLQTRIPRATLERALKEGATILFLGRVYAPHQLWINEQSLASTGDVLGKLLFIDLRESEWQRDTGLAITLRFQNVNRYAVPELTQFELGAIGFVTPKTQDKLANQVSFSTWARPLALGLINILVTVAFFLFWRQDTLKQEFLWFSGYTLILGATQILTIPALIIALGDWNHRIKLPLHAFEVGYALILSLSFIRSDPRWTRGTLVFLLLVGVFSFIVAPDPQLRLKLQSLFYYYGAIGFAAVGALLCMGEIWFAQNLPKHRQRRLIQFAGGLTLISALYFYNANGAGSTEAVMTFQRFAHLGVTIILAAIVFTHFRELTDLARTNPLSRFHRDPEQLGKPVRGLIMNFDLKGSGALKEHLPAKYSEATAHAVGAFRTIWLQHGGIETSTIQGDGLKVLFPCSPEAVQDLLSGFLPGLFAAGPLATQILQNDGLCPDGWQARFRALFAYGAIVPVTTTTGSLVTPQWLDGEGNPLFTSARLEEIEKEYIDPRRRESVALVARGDFELGAALMQESQTHPGKEGKDIAFSLIRSTAFAPELSRAAQCRPEPPVFR